jgi:hypothetical protein
MHGLSFIHGSLLLAHVIDSSNARCLSSVVKCGIKISLNQDSSTVWCMSHCSAD